MAFISYYIGIAWHKNDTGAKLFDVDESSSGHSKANPKLTLLWAAPYRQCYGQIGLHICVRNPATSAAVDYNLFLLSW